MKFEAPIAAAWREHCRRPARACAVAFGFFLATAVFVCFFILFEAVHESENAMLRNLGGYFAAFSPLPADSVATPPAEIPKPIYPNEGFVAGTVLTALLPISLVDEIKRCPNVADVSPVLQFSMKSNRGGHFFILGGIDMTRPMAVARTCCAPADVVDGVFLGNATGSGGFGAMLDDGYASVQGYKVGDIIEIGDRKFTVTGIVNTGVRPSRADVYLPWEDAEQIISSRLSEPLGKRTGLFLVAVNSAQGQEEAIEAVKRITGGVITSYNCFRPAARVMGITSKTAVFLSVLLYLSAIVFSLKTQFGGLIERRREFGILRAIGWSDKVLVHQLLWEAVIPAFLGSVTGALAALPTAHFMTLQVLKAAEAPCAISLNISVAFYGIALTLLGSLCAGLLTALLLVRSRPAEALRAI